MNVNKPQNDLNIRKEWLIENINMYTNDELAVKFNERFKTTYDNNYIRTMAWKFGIKRNPDTLKAMRLKNKKLVEEAWGYMDKKYTFRKKIRRLQWQLKE